jgi:hypothetical protein
MKKILPLILLALVFSGVINGQSFDWNLRGGLNIMNSKSDGEDIALLYHAGVQAGVRITKFGFYGEFLYSAQENQYGGDPVAYLNFGILMKGYLLRFMFFEFGGSYMTMAGDSGHDPDDLNPDKMFAPFAGLGVNFSRFEITLRSTVKQDYGLFQATAAIKF